MGTSYQKGWVSLRGKKWYGYFRRTILDPETLLTKYGLERIVYRMPP